MTVIKRDPEAVAISVGRLVEAGYTVTHQYTDGVVRLTKQLEGDEVAVFVDLVAVIRPLHTNASRLAAIELRGMGIETVERSIIGTAL